MSSTSAVSVLAQGLRELRDFAEGPDGEELRETTGLTGEQIEAALGGEQLPTREVTLALVEAWEGDGEAWREYWGQIAALDTGAKKAETPTPPEPSIIIPIPAAEPEQADEQNDAVRAQSAARAQLEANAQAAIARAEDDEGESSDESEKDAAQSTEQEQTHTESVAESKAATEALASVADPAMPPPAVVVPSKVIPAQQPAKKSPLTRVGVPVLLFAIGVGVGAFGDHTLNSKQTSTNTSSSVPPISATSSRPTHTSVLSPSSGVTSSSNPTAIATTSSSNPTATGTSPTGSAGSASSTVSPGTVLGTYVGIQLASGYSVNFLADPYHPAAGTSNGQDTMGFFASSFVDGRFYADRVAVLDPTDTGSFTSCLNNTRYQHDVLLSQVSTGSTFCITTGTGHLVAVTVRRMPSSTDANPYAVVDMTVWQDD